MPITDKVAKIRRYGPATQATFAVQFLDKDNNQEKFDHNVNMIRVHDMKDDLESIQESTADFQPSELRKQFTEYKFYAMTNDTSWKKFVDTFDCLL